MYCIRTGFLWLIGPVSPPNRSAIAKDGSSQPSTVSLRNHYNKMEDHESYHHDDEEEDNKTNQWLVPLVTMLVLTIIAVVLTSSVAIFNLRYPQHDNGSNTNVRLENSSREPSLSGMITLPTTMPTTKTPTLHPIPTTAPESTTVGPTAMATTTEQPTWTPSTPEPLMTAGPTTEPTTTQAPSEQPTAAPTAPELLPEIIYSLTTSGGIDYYHCYNNRESTTTRHPKKETATVFGGHHVVLLHGASFDRTVWKKGTGIIGDFCSRPGIRVSALDLSVWTDFVGLQVVLDDMADQLRGSTSTMPKTKPVVLVTPSASSWTMVSWILASDDDKEQLPTYLEAWVPVAPVHLKSAEDDEIADAIGKLPVLALYGDEDGKAKRYSERLEEVIGKDGNIQVVELDGGRGPYLRSPDDFVQEIMEFLAAMFE